MDRINIKKLGFATGLTAALLYLGCMIVMAIVGREGSITFFNSLLHGMDTKSIIRMDIPYGESILGLVLIFIIGWLSGACIATLYNMQTKGKIIKNNNDETN